MKIDKKLSASGGFTHLTPTSGCAPGPLLRLCPRPPLSARAQWCSGGGMRGNAVPPNILLEERRSPTYYQDMGER